MVNKALLQDLRISMQELMDDFFTHLRISILEDGLQDAASREFALNIAKIKISQVQHAMTYARDLCVAAQESLVERRKSDGQ